MDMRGYISEIKLKLTGGILDLELEDSALEQVVNAAFREIQRYIDSTLLATIPYKPCIDLSECGVSSVSRVFRAKGYLNSDGTENAGTMVDPMYAAQWQLLGGVGGLYNMQDWTYNYGAWNTMLQVRNTTSTDLIFRFDRHTCKLYINVAYDKPQYITIEYVPRYNDVSQIASDFWIDKLMRLSIAIAKETIGRVRNRFTQSNALWQQDGQAILEEGIAEQAAIREELTANSQLVFPID